MATLWWLVPVQPGLERRRLTDGPFTIGRKGTCTYIIPEDFAYVSGEHCRFHARLGNVAGVEVEDLSANGTFVNGVKIGRGKRGNVSIGEEISLAKPTRRDGALKFKLELDPNTSAIPAAPQDGNDTIAQPPVPENLARGADAEIVEGAQEGLIPQPAMPASAAAAAEADRVEVMEAQPVEAQPPPTSAYLTPTPAAGAPPPTAAYLTPAPVASAAPPTSGSGTAHVGRACNTPLSDRLMNGISGGVSRPANHAPAGGELAGADPVEILSEELAPSEAPSAQVSTPAPATSAQASAGLIAASAARAAIENSAAGAQHSGVPLSAAESAPSVQEASAGIPASGAASATPATVRAATPGPAAVVAAIVSAATSAPAVSSPPTAAPAAAAAPPAEVAVVTPAPAAVAAVAPLDLATSPAAALCVAPPPASPHAAPAAVAATVAAPAAAAAGSGEGHTTASAAARVAGLANGLQEALIQEQRKADQELVKIAAQQRQEEARCAALVEELREAHALLAQERQAWQQKRQGMQRELQVPSPVRLGSKAALAEANVTLAGECQELQQTMLQLRQKSDRLEGDLQPLEESLAMKRRANERLRSELCDERACAERLDLEASRMRAEVEEASEREQSAQERLRLATARNAALEEQCAAACDEERSAKESVQKLRLQLDSRNEKLRFLRGAVRDHDQRVSDRLGILRQALLEIPLTQDPSQSLRAAPAGCEADRADGGRDEVDPTMSYPGEKEGAAAGQGQRLRARECSPTQAAPPLAAIDDNLGRAGALAGAGEGSIPVAKRRRVPSVECAAEEEAAVVM
mmetsp:Transcript_52363/g.125038  ORF Transcript_52363/g.125038 Transcript_52363/m.125038 type:complete len:810 (-) Transcript_52363:86-2515(-)